MVDEPKPRKIELTGIPSEEKVGKPRVRFRIFRLLRQDKRILSSLVIILIVSIVLSVIGFIIAMPKIGLVMVAILSIVLNISSFCLGFRLEEKEELLIDPDDYYKSKI